MDSAVEVALIAAGAGAIGYGLNWVGSMWSTRATTRQAEMKIAADHASWLRDQRADLYLEMNRFLRVAANKRHQLIREGEASPDLHLQIASAVEMYSTPELTDLGVKGTTFVGQETALLFDRAMIANMAAWRAYLESIQASMAADTRHVAVTESVAKALEEARQADRAVFRAIKLDVSWTEYTKPHLRARRRARRLQLRLIRTAKKDIEAGKGIAALGEPVNERSGWPQL